VWDRARAAAAQGFNKIQGKPFKVSEIEAKIEEVCQ